MPHLIGFLHNFTLARYVGRVQKSTFVILIGCTLRLRTLGSLGAVSRAALRITANMHHWTNDSLTNDSGGLLAWQFPRSLSLLQTGVSISAFDSLRNDPASRAIGYPHDGR